MSFTPPVDSVVNDPVLRKLTPGLRAVVQNRALLIGKNVGGDLVIDGVLDNTSGLQNVAVAEDAEDTVNQLIVSYAGKSRPDDDTVRNAGFNVIEDYKEGQFLVVTPVALTAREQNVHRAAGILHSELLALASLESIGSIEANFAMRIPEPDPAQILTADEVQTLESARSETELQRLWGIRDTNAPQVQSSSNPRTIIVAVIDTGVDYNHPDLRDNMWVNEVERKGATGVDDDRNGVIDDVYGASFANGQTSGNPLDDQGHGTHCAGTVAAVANNSGVIGMAQTRIMALKFLGRDGSGSTADAIKCIDYARRQGAHVLSNSWGSAGRVSAALNQAIERARAADILFIAAAGNDNRNNDLVPNSPSNAENENVIAVGSININDGRSSFSNYGLQSVDIGAPGGTSSGVKTDDILSTYPNGKYAYLAGTSMATPHVSGAAALILGHPDFQNASFLDVKMAILQNARSNQALTRFWPQGRELDVSFLLSGGGGGGGGNGGGGGGNTTPIAENSEGKFYYQSGRRFVSETVLVNRVVRLDRPAQVYLQAGPSATMDAKPVTFLTGISISTTQHKSSFRLATTTLKNHYVPFGTSLTTRLPAGTHRIQWWIRVPRNGSILVRGGGALDVQAFAVNE
jgi:subtilisin family serine protease